MCDGLISFHFILFFCLSIDGSNSNLMFCLVFAWVAAWSSGGCGGTMLKNSTTKTYRQTNAIHLKLMKAYCGIKSSASCSQSPWGFACNFQYPLNEVINESLWTCRTKYACYGQYYYSISPNMNAVQRGLALCSACLCASVLCQLKSSTMHWNALQAASDGYIWSHK